jgi:hypothetical protein
MSVDSRSHFNVPYNYANGLQVLFQCSIQPCQWTPGSISMFHTTMSVDSRSHFNVPYWNGTWSPLTWLYGTLKWHLESTDMVVWDIEMAPGVHWHVDPRSHFNVPYNHVSGLQVPFQCSIQPCQWTPGPISMFHTTMSVDSRSHFNVPYNHVGGLQVPFQCPIQPCRWTPGGITDVIGGPHDFPPPGSDRSDEFQKLCCMEHWNGTWGRSLHRIRFYLEFCLQFRQHGNVSIIKMWSLNDNMIERLHREIELEIERV